MNRHDRTVRMKSTAGYLGTGEAPAPMGLTKADRQNLQRQIEQRGLSRCWRDPKLTRAQREELSRQRKAAYDAKQAQTKA